MQREATRQPIGSRRRQSAPPKTPSGAAKKPFDIVITDHRMPRMGGLQLVQRLRDKEFAGKILVLSGHLCDEDISAYEAMNVDMMMSKPFDFEELQSAVALLTKGASVRVAA